MVLMLTPTATRVSYLPSLNDGVGGAGGVSMTIMVLNEAGQRASDCVRPGARKGRAGQPSATSTSFVGRE